MLSNYSASCERILQFAQNEASQRRHRYIHTEYLLLGLLQDSNFATRILEDLGCNLGKLKRMCVAECSVGDHTPKEGLRLTSRVRGIIDQASAQQKAFGHPEMDGSHILLGILLEKDGVAGRILRQAGVTYENVREALLDRGPAEPIRVSRSDRPKSRAAKKSFWQFLSRV